MNNQHLLVLCALFLPFVITVVWFAQMFWRDWRRHRRIMAVLREIELSIELVRTSPPGQLFARFERTVELLEYVDRYLKEK